MLNNQRLHRQTENSCFTRDRRCRRSAFTLVEILVALGVMMLLLIIILIPVNMGLDVFHIGRARSEVTQANQLVINQLASELKRAVHVFPNEQMPGITNKSPYSTDSTIAAAPYLVDGTNTRVSNTARLDFLLPAVSANGSIITPLKPTNYLVTYYARRLKPKNDDGTDNPYDVFSNPVVLWRAQYPYGYDDTTAVANLGPFRYSDWSKPANSWLTQKPNGEPNLEAQSDTSGGAISASHTALMPNDMALVISGNSLQPDSSFICDDSNNDGKIDRVSISLLLAKHDASSDSRKHQIRLTRTVELPNVK